MFGLLLEGVFNHGEVIWLETRWSLRRLFRSFIYVQGLNPNDPAWVALNGWVEVMPAHQMIRYCDWRGSITYRYWINNEILLNGKPMILRIKGWKRDADPVENDAYEAITKAHDLLFYREIEAHLDKEALPVERDEASEE